MSGFVHRYASSAERFDMHIRKGNLVFNTYDHDWCCKEPCIKPSFLDVACMKLNQACNDINVRNLTATITLAFPCRHGVCCTTIMMYHAVPMLHRLALYGQWVEVKEAVTPDDREDYLSETHREEHDFTSL